MRPATIRFGSRILWLAIGIAVGVGVLGIIAASWRDILMAAVLILLSGLALVVGQTSRRRYRDRGRRNGRVSTRDGRSPECRLCKEDGRRRVMTEGVDLESQLGNSIARHLATLLGFGLMTSPAPRTDHRYPDFHQLGIEVQR